jgi:hypothetical protein
MRQTLRGAITLKLTYRPEWRNSAQTRDQMSKSYSRTYLETSTIISQTSTTIPWASPSQRIMSVTSEGDRSPSASAYSGNGSRERNRSHARFDA